MSGELLLGILGFTITFTIGYLVGQDVQLRRDVERRRWEDIRYIERARRLEREAARKRGE